MLDNAGMACVIEISQISLGTHIQSNMHANTNYIIAD